MNDKPKDLLQIPSPKILACPMLPNVKVDYRKIIGSSDSSEESVYHTGEKMKTVVLVPDACLLALLFSPVFS